MRINSRNNYLHLGWELDSLQKMLIEAEIQLRYTKDKLQFAKEQLQKSATTIKKSRRHLDFLEVQMDGVHDKLERVWILFRNGPAE